MPCFSQDNLFYIAKDSFIPIYPTRTISTATQEEGDTVYFIVPSDLWVEDCKVIAKNSIIKAKISMLKMPVKGINAAMKIQAEELIAPNGMHYPLNGDIEFKGNKQIGGDLTNPLSYNKALFPRRGEYYVGVIAQLVPSGDYEFGQHVTIHPNEMLQLVLEEDFTSY